MLSALVVTYLFLGGAGAGACFVLAALGLFVPKGDVCAADTRFLRTARFLPHRPSASFFIVGYTAALLALTIGSVCLVADLGRADRIAFLFVSPVFTLLNAGTWSIACCLVLIGFMLAAWGSVLRCSVAFVKILQAALLGVSLFVMVYTGMLLSSLAAVPLWHSAWVPVLFVLSALSCGIALVIAAEQVTGRASSFCGVMRSLVRFDAVVIVLETAALVALVALVFADAQGVTATQTLAAQATSLDVLLNGRFSWVFWAVFVAVGLFVPFCAEVAALTRVSGLMRPVPSFCVSACVLSGGFALRACIVWAGVHPIVSSASAMLIG